MLHRKSASLIGKEDGASAQRTLAMEIAALASLKEALRHMAFAEACQILAGAEGRIIVSGMGKSGHVARKIAATFASTGTPALFVHPAEASHGDLGMITPQDAILALSQSGETEEMANLLAYSRRFEIPLILITAGKKSSLAKKADLVLLLPAAKEAGAIGLAPTSSALMQMALGDALAIALLERSGFTPERFKDFHPGGAIGARLRLARDIMHKPPHIPLAAPDETMTRVLIEMSEKGFGCVGIVSNEKLIGIITDGDLRRHMDARMLEKKARHVMTAAPKTIAPETLAAAALAAMTSARITSLFVVEEERPTGLLHIHDFLRLGVI